jgi:hypothetical protein
MPDRPAQKITFGEMREMGVLPAVLSYKIIVAPAAGVLMQTACSIPGPRLDCRRARAGDVTAKLSRCWADQQQRAG